jgi:hypothetical protein
MKSKHDEGKKMASKAMRKTKEEKKDRKKERKELYAHTVLASNNHIIDEYFQ